MSKLLALDQASRISGWSVFNDRDELIAHGKIDLKDENIGERLVVLRQEINKLINDFEIDEVAFEDIQMQSSVGNNVQTFKALANVYGVILELLEERHLSYTIVSSNSWKSTLGIKGRKRAEQKQNAQKYVEETYGIKPTQDECDSICIGSHIIKTTRGHDWSN